MRGGCRKALLFTSMIMPSQIQPVTHLHKAQTRGFVVFAYTPSCCRDGCAMVASWSCREEGSFSLQSPSLFLEPRVNIMKTKFIELHLSISPRMENHHLIYGRRNPGVKAHTPVWWKNKPSVLLALPGCPGSRGSRLAGAKQQLDEARMASPSPELCEGISRHFHQVSA